MTLEKELKMMSFYIFNECIGHCGHYYLSLQNHCTFMLVDSSRSFTVVKFVLFKAISTPTEHIMSHKYHSMSVNRLINMEYI